MGRRIVFYSLLFFASFSFNDAYSGKHFVSSFGQMYPGTDSVVDFDCVHARLKRFEEFATNYVQFNKLPSDNIVVGAMTVVYRDSDSKESPQVAKTFYFEVNNSQGRRGIIAFESTPAPHELEVSWGRSRLGMIDGHTHLAFESEEKKAFCPRRLHDFLGKYGTSDDLRSPFMRMQEHDETRPLDELIDASTKLQKKMPNLIPSLRITLENLQKLLEHEFLKRKEDPYLLHEGNKGILDPQDLDRSRNAASFTLLIKNLSVGGFLNILSEKEFQNCCNAVDHKTTLFYEACWHSEQRLCHHLLDQLDGAETRETMSDDTDSEVSYSSEGYDIEASEKNQSQRAPVEEKMHGFNWDQIEEVGGDLKPAYIFVHVHSKLQFCDMCEFTLGELFLNRLGAKLTKYKIGGILGSYSKSDASASSSSGEVVDLSETISWERVIQAREQGVPPQFYVKRLNPS